MKSKVTVIIPAYDEEGSIASVLEEIPRDVVDRVIVVDNGSADRTGEIASGLGAEVVREERRGYGSAVLAGLDALASRTGKKGDTIAVFVNADGSDDPGEVPLLIAPIEGGEADLVIGSREMGLAEPGSLTLYQRWGNRLATTLIRWTCGVRYTDLGPFRAIRWDAYRALAMEDTGFGWTVEMQVKAARRGLRVKELPVHYRPRRAGQSKISGTVSGTVRAGSKILYSVVRYRWF